MVLSGTVISATKEAVSIQFDGVAGYCVDISVADGKAVAGAGGR